MSHGGHEKKFFGGRKLTIALIALFVITFCLIFIPFAPPVASDEEVVIGALLPLTGPLSDIGNERKNGLDLALEDIQNSGRKVTIKYVDTGCDEGKTIDGYFSLLNEGVQIIIGPVNTFEAEAIAPYVEMYKTPVITFANGVTLDEYKNYLFRFTPSDKYVVTGLINSIRKSGGDTKSLAIVWKNDQYGSELARYTMETIEEEHPEIAVSSIPLTSIDAAVNQIAKKRPGAIFVIPENAKQLSDLRTAAYEKGLTRFSYWYAADTGIGDEVINNIDCIDTFIVTQRKADSNAEFNKRYLEKYGSEPNGFAPYSYDALMTAVDVIYSSGNNGPAFAAALKKYRKLGITGPINFDEELNRFPLMETLGAGYKEWYTVSNDDYLVTRDEQTLRAYSGLLQDMKAAYHAGKMDEFEQLHTWWKKNDFNAYLDYSESKTA